MKRLAATLASLSLIASASAQANPTETSPGSRPMLTLDDVRTVAPALEKYAQGTLLGDLWKRPGLAPRDRSLVTLAALIARNQTVELDHYLDLALDNGVQPREISEIITHLAFYAGWANAMAAVAVAKDVFARRGIGADQLPAASPEPLPLDEAAETRRATLVEQQFGAVAPGVVQYTTDVLFRDLWLRPDRAPGPEPGHRQRPDRFRPGRADSVSPQPGDGQRLDAGAGRGGHHAPGVLRRLAQRLLGPAGREGGVRETASLGATRHRQIRQLGVPPHERRVRHEGRSLGHGRGPGRGDRAGAAARLLRAGGRRRPAARRSRPAHGRANGRGGRTPPASAVAARGRSPSRSCSHRQSHARRGGARGSAWPCAAAWAVRCGPPPGSRR